MKLSRRSAFTAHPGLPKAASVTVDLTESNPTRVGISPRVSLPEVHDYRPDPKGGLEARTAIARWYGGHVEPNEVLLCSGTSEAYAHLLTLLADPDDAVVAPVPSYPLVDVLAQLAGVRWVAAPQRLEGDRFVLDVSLLEPALEEDVKAVVLVHPNHPTGALSPVEEVAKLAARCAETGRALIIDEVFAAPEQSLVHHHHPCLTFHLGGLSKACGLPQHKLAWVVAKGPQAPEALARLEEAADAYLSVGAAVQTAVPSMLAESAAFRARVEARVAENRAVLERLKPGDATWSLAPRDGGWVQLIRLPKKPGEMVVVRELAERGVAVQWGKLFDAPTGDWLVVSLLPEPQVFAQGAEILAKVL